MRALLQKRRSLSAKGRRLLAEMGEPPCVEAAAPAEGGLPLGEEAPTAVVEEYTSSRGEDVGRR